LLRACCPDWPWRRRPGRSGGRFPGARSSGDELVGSTDVRGGGGEDVGEEFGEVGSAAEPLLVAARVRVVMVMVSVYRSGSSKPVRSSPLTVSGVVTRSICTSCSAVVGVQSDVTRSDGGSKQSASRLDDSGIIAAARYWLSATSGAHPGAAGVPAVARSGCIGSPSEHPDPGRVAPEAVGDPPLATSPTVSRAGGDIPGSDRTYFAGRTCASGPG